MSTYTHVSDQHSTFDTKVIVATAPESHYVLDGLLGNATDLPVFEHATDTHGATLANFALFDLVGKQLSPRIRPHRYRPGGRRGSRRTTPPSSTAPTTRNGQPIPAWQPKMRKDGWTCSSCRFLLVE